MRYLGWIIKLTVFMLLFVFTSRNTDSTVLRGFGEARWEAPLVCFLLIFFVLGLLTGVLLLLPELWRAHRARRQAERTMREAHPLPDDAAEAAPSRKFWW